MKTPFEQASYLAQVRRLRALAEAAVLRYPIRAERIHFINHGENTTFRVEASRGRKYLLRIHRRDYHTKAAIQEELAWLALLAKEGLHVPRPVPSRQGHLVETVSSASVGAERNCCLFEWVEGRFIEQSLSPSHMKLLGRVTAELQSLTPRGGTKKRRYWTAEGLVGAHSKFGSIDALAGIRRDQQKVISAARKQVHGRLERFEKRFPNRMGLIHADLHFGNVLSAGGGLGVIDFDDCGHGFHAYDLVVPYLSAGHILGARGKKRLPAYKEALISGYASRASWDTEDDAVFGDLVTARKLTMLGWLNSRSDNPRLKKRLKGAVSGVLEYLRADRRMR